MPAIDALQDLKQELIRKSTNGSVFIGEHAIAATIDETTLFDATSGDLDALPADYADLGYTTDAGAQFARAITESNITSWQSISPTRSDTTADTTTLQVSCQETKLETIGLYVGAAQATIKTTPDPSGVVRIDKPVTPVVRYYRVLSIAVDEQDVGEIVIARYLPKAKVTNYDNQNFDKSDNAVPWSVTFTGFVDDVVGTAESYLFGGAGWKALLTSMGFTLGT